MWSYRNQLEHPGLARDHYHNHGHRIVLQGHNILHEGNELLCSALAMGRP
jgi:hypothetical protein